jgi:predicted transcriptional regulator of viral defense system
LKYAKSATMNSEWVRIFESNNGYLHSRQLTKRSQYYQLRKLVDQGEIVMLKRGLYHLADMPGSDEWAKIAQIVPLGVICMFSAWQYWQLSTQVPVSYHIAIGKKEKAVVPQYPPIQLYYWQDQAAKLGVTEVTRDGHQVRIFNPEKSVCDAIRFRNKIGMDLVAEILKNYLSGPDKNIDLLLKYAGSLRIAKPISDYLRIIL